MRVVEDALVELFGGIPADVPIRVNLAAPPIGPALVRAVTQPDLLFVGRSRRGLARRLLLGSISAYCATHAPCPVVCVPRPEAPHRMYTTKGRQPKITRE
jgi:nucleotide-binding universal stress UspA family protein